jgi:hypothetical protein
MPTLLPKKFTDLNQDTPTDSDLVLIARPDSNGGDVLATVSDLLNTPSGQVIANPVDAELLNFRFDPYNLNQNGYNNGKYTGAQFGNVVWDPNQSVFRIFYADGVSSIMTMWGDSPKSFRDVSVALAPGTVFDTACDVPFVWYEAGEDRPWRMIYRGTGAGNSQICLATAVQNVTGAPVWERKDTNNNVLTTPIILSGPVGAWDQGSIDFGGVIKVGAIYYIYYDTIYTAQRLTGVAQSTDLVHWTKYSGNPTFKGVVNIDLPTQGPDRISDGTPDAAQGFFCGDIVYWPREDKSPRFVYITPHYSGVHTLPSYDVYVSDNVIMTKANRTYIGKIFKTNTNDKYVSGMLIDSSGCDTPRIVTDDITRNVATSTITGNDVILMASVKPGTDNFVMCPLIWNKTLNGASLVNVVADVPSVSPVFQLSNGNSHTKALWYPALTGDTRDISGNGYNLGGQPTMINSNGVTYTAANHEFSSYGKSTGTILDNVLKAITRDFSIELKMSMASNFTSGNRTPWCYDGGSGKHHFYPYLSVSGGNYSINFSSTIGGSTVNVVCALGTINLNQEYRIGIFRDATAGKIYFFKDGVLLNSGGTTFAGTIDTLANVPIYMGSNSTALYWDGTVDEVVVSDICKHTSNYTAAAPVLTYPTTGYIYTPVQDWGPGNNKTGICEVLNQTLPAGCGITVLYRNAHPTLTNPDKSVNITDFSSTPSYGRYAQFCIVLTGTGALTPNFDSVSMYGQDPGISGKVPYTGATADLDLGAHNIKAANIEIRISFTFQNGGAALAAGLADIVAALDVPATLTDVYLMAPDGVTGNVAIDIFRRNAAVPASNTYSIIRPSGSGSGAYPALSSASYGKVTSFANWNSVTFAADDVIQVAINASPTPTVNFLTVELVFKI